MVDGDILYSKKEIATEIYSKKNSKTVETKQYHTANLIGVGKNVVIRIDPSMNSYINEINSAINLWNSVPNIRFTIGIYNPSIPSQPYNVTITNRTIPACGAAYPPMNGNPGSSIQINLNYFPNQSFDQRQATIAHEIGHTLGFRHTNWRGYETKDGRELNTGAYFNAVHIIGTATNTDNLSIMNGMVCGTAPTTLSNFDRIAYAFMYPLSPPVAGTSPVYRYYDVNSGNHFYTTNYGELGHGNNYGHVFVGIAFFAYTTQVSGTVPVYRHYRAGNTNYPSNHYYTTSSGNFPTYVNEGIRFYAFPYQASGTIPVQQYYDDLHHFYTVNPNEFVPGIPNSFIYTGNAFYAY